MMHIVLSKIRRNLLFFYPTGEELQEFANAFASHGVPDTIKFWAVIDVKKHQITKPTMNQRAMYSGHKRIHCIKYQTLEVPNGLILHCSVGDDGRRGDGFVLRKSGLIPFLRQHSIVFGLYRILGDSAYPNNDVMLSVFKGNPARLPPHASAFNNIVCPLRTSVEWGYEKIIKYWAFLDFKKQMKIGRSGIIAMWHMAVFLTNVVTCAKGGNQISTYFNLAPPSLENYVIRVIS
jgi:hypothetical protein